MYWFKVWLDQETKLWVVQPMKTQEPLGDARAVRTKREILDLLPDMPLNAKRSKDWLG